MSFLKECVIDGNTAFLYFTGYGIPLFHWLQHSFISLVTAFLQMHYLYSYSIRIK